MTTPFEDSSGAAWTTYAEELAYVDTILGPRLTKTTLTTTVQGRDLYALRVGAASATGSPLVVEATMHGDEPAPREAALTWARTLAESADPTVASFLDDVPIYIVPTANPDGRVANSRNNANAVDFNRDGVKLSQPESLAVMSLIGGLVPVAVLSAHELPPSFPGGTTNVYTAAPTQLGGGTINSAVYSASSSLAVTLRSQLIAQGITATGYAASNNLGMFGTSLGAYGSLFTLFETSGTDDAAFTPWQRHAWHLAGWNLWLAHMIANYDTLASTVALARAATSVRIYSGTPQWQIGGLPPNTALYVAATGYGLTAAQYATAQDALDAWGLSATPDGSDYIVWLNQPAAANAALILDPDSEEFVVAGSRLTDMPPPPPTADRRRGAIAAL